MVDCEWLKVKSRFTPESGMGLTFPEVGGWVGIMEEEIS